MMKGKNVLVVGASSGIGQALAQDLSDKGAQVYGTYHQHEPAEKGVIAYHPLNVLDESLGLDFLPDALHGLAYCPGSITLKPFHRLTVEDFTQDYALQVLGAVKVIQAALGRLKASGGASVVLFSTVAVQSGLPNHALVSASKGGIEGLTRALAAELAPKIRVNAIAPSLTDTPLAAGLLKNEKMREASASRHALRRIGQPEDIARMAASLLSEDAAWMSGQILHVDGGLSTLRV